MRMTKKLAAEVEEQRLRHSGQTSKRVASIASKGLINPGLLTISEVRIVCASALGQTQRDEVNPDDPITSAL
jgi:hypothetical protein